jgi:hypothetical protein
MLPKNQFLIRPNARNNLIERLFWFALSFTYGRDDYRAALRQLGEIELTARSSGEDEAVPYYDLRSQGHV